MTIVDDTAEGGCTVKTTAESKTSAEVKATVTDASGNTGTDTAPVTVIGSRKRRTTKKTVA